MWPFKTAVKKRATKYYPKQTKENLVETLTREINAIDAIVESAPPIDKYAEGALAQVLLASGAHYQHLKLSRRKLRKREMELIEYLSTVSPRETTFPASCLRLHSQLNELSDGSALIKVKSIELLNLFVFLLSRLEE